MQRTLNSAMTGDSVRLRLDETLGCDGNERRKKKKVATLTRAMNSSVSGRIGVWSAAVMSG